MTKRITVYSVIVFFIATVFISFMVSNLKAASVGQTLSSVKIIDPNDNPKWIPFLGKKVVTVMYTDPDNKDVNDPLSQAIKAKNYSKAKYIGIGIANCKDTWIPNAGIRYKARQKQAQFPDALIMLDENKSVSTKWGLGNCDDAAVVIVIGKDKKVKYVKKITTQAQSKAMISGVLTILDREIAK